MFTTTAFRESQLISTNAILTLGYVGVNLRYTQNRRTVESVLQIFQQRFCSPPSALDSIIVDQLANIVIAGCVSYSKYKQFIYITRIHSLLYYKGTQFIILPGYTVYYITRMLSVNLSVIYVDLVRCI